MNEDLHSTSLPPEPIKDTLQARGHFNKELVRNVVLVIELFAIGPLLGNLLTFLRSTDGGPAITPLLNSTPLTGLLIGLVVLAGAALVGVVDARIFGARSGLGGAGIMFGWAALHTGRTEDLLRVYSSTDLIPRLCAEGIVCGLALLWIVRRIIVQAPPAHDPGSQGSAGDPIEAGWSSLIRPSSLVAALAAMVGAGVAAWLVAFHGSKGQTIFATFIGGIAAGAASAVVSAGGDSKDAKRPVDPVLSACLGMVILGILAPLTLLVLKSSAPSAAFSGELFRRSLAQIHAFDWAAGALLGIPVGLGWAGAHAQAPSRENAVAAT